MPIQFVTSILRLMENATGQLGWYYLVVRGTGWSLRSLRNMGKHTILHGTEPDHEAKINALFTCDRQLLQNHLTNQFRIQNLPNVKAQNDWARIADILDLGATAPEAVGQAVPPTASDVRVVPITELRRLYRWLRKAKKGMHLAIGRGIASHPKALAELCEQSRKKVATYNNPEPFCPRPRAPLEAPADWVIEDTNDLVGMIAANNGKLDVIGHRDLNCLYVEREINPLRTTKSVYETGGKARSSGGGGIDMLLVNADEGTPVVAEIKVGNDTNCLFGLIQALTYSIELCTAHQYSRIRNSLGKRASTQIRQPDDQTGICPIDIYVVLYATPDTTLDNELCELSKSIATQLQNNDDFKRWIRRIVFLEAVPGNDQSIKFRKTFSSLD